MTEVDPPEPGPAASSSVDRGAPEPRTLAFVQRLTRWRTPSPRWRRAIQVLAAAVFVGGIVVSFQRLELEVADIRWWPLVVLAVVGTPLTIVANAAELRVMARCLDRDAALSWPRAVRVVVLATAANILPIPGGAMVRIQALRAGGAGGGRATSINLIAALLWVATAIGVAGVAALGFAPLTGVLAMGGAVVGLAVSAGALRATMPVWSWSSAATLWGVEVATTLLHAAKLYLALSALGIAAGLDQALVLGVAGPVSAAAGVFPSGLGLAEVLAALTATLVALAPAAGFSATAVVRVVGLLSTAPLVVVGDHRDLTTRSAEGADPAGGRPGTPPTG